MFVTNQGLWIDLFFQPPDSQSWIGLELKCQSRSDRDSLIGKLDTDLTKIAEHGVRVRAVQVLLGTLTPVTDLERYLPQVAATANLTARGGQRDCRSSSAMSFWPAGSSISVSG
jgi:hypothetical protein